MVKIKYTVDARCLLTGQERTPWNFTVTPSWVLKSQRPVLRWCILEEGGLLGLREPYSGYHLQLSGFPMGGRLAVLAGTKINGRQLAEGRSPPSKKAKRFPSTGPEATLSVKT